MPETFIRTAIQKTTQKTTRAAGSGAAAICDATIVDRTVPTNCACWLKPPSTAVASLPLPLQLSTRSRDYCATQPFLTILSLL
jgi:hypothetical protein